MIANSRKQAWEVVYPSVVRRISRDMKPIVTLRMALQRDKSRSLYLPLTKVEALKLAEAIKAQAEMLPDS